MTSTSTPDQPELWIARDGSTHPHLRGLCFVFQEKPRWCEELNGWQARGLMCLDEFKKPVWPLENGQMARLVIVPNTVTSAFATSAATNDESMPTRCDSVGTTR